MVSRIRWQIVLALAGTLAILALFGSVALFTAAGSLPPGGSVYVEGVVGAATMLNPLLEQSDAPQSARDLHALLFDGLTTHGPDGAPLPALAERWTISPDARVYTFTLRSGLRWHDATPVTAADVVWTVASVQDSGFPGNPTLHEFWRNIEAEQIDERRIRYTLPSPYAPFLRSTELPVLPAHLLQSVPVERWHEAPFSRAPVGTGPFRLERLTADEAVLRPFEGAVRGRPAVEQLVLRFFPTVAAAHEALLRRDIQGVATVGTYAPPAGRTLRTTTTALDQYAILLFNLTDSSLGNLQLRRALAQGLDRATLIQTVIGPGAQLLDTPILPGSWAATAVSLPAWDAAAAVQTLDALGWRQDRDGQRRKGSEVLRLPLVVADTPLQQAIAAEIARQWEQIGVTVPVEALPPDQLSARLRSRTFTLALHSWGDVGGDPDLYALWHGSQASAGANYAGLRDAVLDRLLSEGRTTPDETRRKEIYGEVQRRWVALIPSLPLFQAQLVFTHDARLEPTGLAASLLLGSADRFRTVTRWTAPAAAGPSKEQVATRAGLERLQEGGFQ